MVQSSLGLFPVLRLDFQTLGIRGRDSNCSQPWMLDLYMKPGKLPYRLIYPGGNLPTTKKCAFWWLCQKMKNVDHINWTLNLFKLHQYLISLLRKTQNTFLEPAVKFFG